MTKEERIRHAERISDRYVSIISPDETNPIMKEIKELPIQDIITIYTNAVKSKMTYRGSLQKVSV